MIFIDRDSSGIVALSLSERTTIANPTFLFSFESIENEFKNFIADDISIYTDRYNKFIITEVGDGGTEDLTNGEIILLPTGFWDYTIYAQTSITNLVPASADEIVERGKVYVRDLNNPLADYSEPTNNEDTYSVPNE
jgi:hypothetical protein